MAWLSNWAKRIKLTIDSTNIDSDLTNFPVSVTLTSGTNAAGIFSELATVSGTKKIAMTTVGGTNQCYVEIERWDWDVEEANLWTKVPTVYSGTDTNLYLYYDSTKSDNTTYVGDTGDTPAKYVWDSNFIGVWHLSDIDNIADSTAYGYDGAWSAFIGSTNIALSKTTAQSTTYLDNPAFVSSLAVDDDIVSYQLTKNNANEWWKVDLATEYTIGKIEMRKTAVSPDRPNDYYIQTADDWAFTTNVVNIITENNQTSQIISWDVGDFGDVTTRYLRVYCHTTSQYVGMQEFRVWELEQPAGDLVDGKIGKAIDFNGTGDVIDCASPASLDDIGTITIESTFKPEGWGESTSGRIVTKADGNEYGWNTYIWDTQDTLGFQQGWSTTDGVWYAPTNAIILDNWYYSAIQYDRSYSTSDKPIMYLNAVVQTVSTTTPPVGTIESDAAQNMLIGARTGPDRYFDGIIDEVRISDTHRSAAWIKATYYSNWDQLITYGTEQGMPTHYYDGYITEEGSPVIRVVSLYYRSTGELIDSTTSSGVGGYYYLTTTISGEHYIVALDDGVGLSYNALILDKLLPRGIE